MRRTLTVAAALGMLALTACDRAITEPYGPLTGTWRYSATGFQYSPSHPDFTCALEVVIKVRQEGNQIEGRQETEPAEFPCTYTDGRVVMMGPAGGVIRGEIQDGRVHFSNAGNWHSFGEMAPDRIEGYLESYGGGSGDELRAVRSGSFVLERISDVGYYGPEA
jgi:hypothetical protein